MGKNWDRLKKDVYSPPPPYKTGKTGKCCFCIMGNRIISLSKWQWLSISITVAIVILINVIGVWHYIRFNKMQVEIAKDEGADPEFLDFITCDYPYLTGCLKFLIIAMLLGALAWLMVFLTTKAFFQRLPLLLKYGGEFLIATFAGIVFAIVSMLFSDNWVHDFSCGPLYGLLRSGFVYYWSKRLVFPATSVLIFWAMHLSNQH